MTRLQDLTKEALSLPTSERARLAAELLDTLPVALADEDEGVAEARRRSAELDVDPGAGLSWAELKKQLGR